MTASALSRRALLRGGLTLGCSAAAFPLATRVTFAAAPGDNRLVVIVLRGALDGLVPLCRTDGGTPFVGEDPHADGLRGKEGRDDQER